LGMYFKLKVYNGCEVQFPANQIRLLSKFPLGICKPPCLQRNST
jgi:hypothetical protein